MIRPARHMDLSVAPVRLAAIVVDELRSASALKVRDLQGIVYERVQKDVGRNLATGLRLLFLIGLIEYDEAADAVVFAELEERSE